MAIGEPGAGRERVRAAEVVAALSLATDLGMGFSLEHGLHSTLVGMRLAERLEVDHAVVRQVYHGCLLFYVGCTVDADLAANLYEDDIHAHFTPAAFGSRAELLRGLSRAVAPPRFAPPARAVRIARGLPRALRATSGHLARQCEVAEMLTDRIGLPPDARALFASLNERWDGKGNPGRAAGDELPLALRIVHVARDATFQAILGGAAGAASVIRERAGGAFDPEVAAEFADAAPDLIAIDAEGSVWDEVLAAEPAPQLSLEGDGIDRALGAMGDFADLISPFLVGHSSGVAELAGAAAGRAWPGGPEETSVRRAAFVHDLGRVAVPAGIWVKPAGLTQDEWEKVRLHPYYTERVLSPSPFLARLAPIASAHHERLDGSGYHRGAAGAALPPEARLLAAADAYHAMIEPRPHRAALAPEQAVDVLSKEASDGRLDPEAVACVIEAAGHRVPRIERPAGLTERETEVVGLLARGLQTKQIAHRLGISVKTADRHIQNAYGKIGVSTRAGATLFAMEYGLVSWGELPIGATAPRA